MECLRLKFRGRAWLWFAGTRVTCHIYGSLLLCNLPKMSFKNTPLSCQLIKLNVGAIAAEIRITTRQLARLANKGVPGVERGPGRYQFIWLDRPETRAWIDERKRFRKGKRKRPPKRQQRLSNAQRFALAIGKFEKQVLSAFNAALADGLTNSELKPWDDAARRLRGVCDRVVARLRYAANFT